MKLSSSTQSLKCLLKEHEVRADFLLIGLVIGNKELTSNDVYARLRVHLTPKQMIHLLSQSLLCCFSLLHRFVYFCLCPIPSAPLPPEAF